MAEPAFKRMSVNEFIRWEDGTDTRYELVEGIPVAMAPPMPGHGMLAVALGGELRSALRPRRPCIVQAEAGIARPERDDTCYIADLAVTCDPPRPGDRLIRDPILVVEILSPSTSVFDRQSKVPDYRRIPSVQEILLINSESVFAEFCAEAASSGSPKSCAVPTRLYRSRRSRSFCRSRNFTKGISCSNHPRNWERNSARRCWESSNMRRSGNAEGAARLPVDDPGDHSVRLVVDNVWAREAAESVSRNPPHIDRKIEAAAAG